LMPGSEKACTVTQAVTQPELEAGRATVTVQVEGISAIVSPQGPVTALPQQLSQTIQPDVTQIKTIDFLFERTDTHGTISTNGECLVPVLDADRLTRPGTAQYAYMQIWNSLLLHKHA
jgi:hypothetical protein